MSSLNTVSGSQVYQNTYSLNSNNGYDGDIEMIDNVGEMDFIPNGFKNVKRKSTDEVWFEILFF